MKTIGIATLLLIAVVAGTQNTPPQPHWQLTDSETLWTERYSNCQYGYYLSLPVGVVAHAEHPPAPHHGFLVRLPDTSARSEVTFDNSDRLIWINAEYNTTERSSLKGVAEYEMGLTGEGKHNFKLTDRRETTLQSRPAIEFRAEYQTERGPVIEDVIVTLHSGIVYEFGLITTQEYYVNDREKFQQLLTGLRFAPLPKGECWNS